MLSRMNGNLWPVAVLVIGAVLMWGGRQVFGQDVVVRDVKANKVAIEKNAASIETTKDTQVAVRLEVSGITSTLNALAEKVGEFDRKLDRLLEQRPAR